MEIQKRENDYAPTLSFPTLDEWEFMLKLGQGLVQTGFMPKGVDTSAKAAAIMLKGRELGIPPMEAIANISIVNGKPTIQAKLMMALVKRAYGRDAIFVAETTETYAKVGYQRNNTTAYYTFTIQMAEKAGLLKPDKWGNDSMYVKYPEPMLRARCISAVCVMEFPDVTGGLYVPGELGDPVEVDGSGEVITVEVNSPTRAPQRQEPKAAPQPAPSAQVGPGNVDRDTGEIREARKADPVPARGHQQTSAPEKAHQRQEANEDKKLRELKQSMARVAQHRGVENHLAEILEAKYKKPAGELTLSELQRAHAWLSTADGPELSHKGQSEGSNSK